MKHWELSKPHHLRIMTMGKMTASLLISYSASQLSTQPKKVPNSMNCLKTMNWQLRPLLYLAKALIRWNVNTCMLQEVLLWRLCFSIYRVRLYFFYGSQSSAVSVNLKVHILRSEIKLTSWYHYLCIPATLMAQWEILMRPRHTPASKTGRWQRGQRCRHYRP